MLCDECDGRAVSAKFKAARLYLEAGLSELWVLQQSFAVRPSLETCDKVIGLENALLEAVRVLEGAVENQIQKRRLQTEQLKKQR